VMLGAGWWAEPTTPALSRRCSNNQLSRCAPIKLLSYLFNSRCDAS
jgi:hypothetical protein